jgi:hypothetical protein
VQLKERPIGRSFPLAVSVPRPRLECDHIERGLDLPGSLIWFLGSRRELKTAALKASSKWTEGDNLMVIRLVGPDERGMEFPK